MKAKLLLVAAIVTLVGCATTPINTATARSTPLSRIYAQDLVIPGEGKVQLIVARDAGAVGSACMTAVYLDGKIVSAIDNAEKVTFYVLPGRYILGTGPNPNGTGLCKYNSERSRREAEIIAEIGKPLKYRLAMNDRGEFSLMPTAF